MTDCTINEPSVTSRGRLPGWLYLYFLMAGCLFFVLVASLYFNRSIVSLQQNAVQTNRTWAQRGHQYAELGRLAAEVNLPGNDVFESENPEEEAKNLHVALQAFDRAMARARADLSSGVVAQDALQLSAGLEALSKNTKAMADEAAAVFAAFERSRAEAGEHMAAMDRQYKEVRTAVHALEEYVNKNKERAFDEQDRETATLTTWQYGLDALIGLLAIGVVVYAMTLSRNIAEASRIAEQNLILLQHSEEALRRESAAAEHANQAKSSFLANMSHEIRTPMNAIMGYAELLLEPDCQEQDRRDAVNVIRRSAQHLLDLIKDVLDISKIEAEKMKVERIATDLPQLVADVASLMRPSASAKGLSFRLSFGDSVPRTIVSDPVRLKQILVNLVGNAVKFTERGEVHLRLSSKVVGDRCIAEFEVRDSGIGMSEEQLSRVFEPFTQADDSTTRRFGGTGLGLTISKRLIDLLGGTLDVKSLQGVGSVFRFTVDGGTIEDVEFVQGFSESLLNRPESHTENVRLRLHGRILLAEDGPDNQRLIAGHLRKAGASVILAENGQVAIDMVRSHTFDLILMDMQMPEMDGYAATRELRHRGCTLPIVALTANAMSEDRAKCLAAGCTEYLTKPIEKNALIRAAADYLEHEEEIAPDASTNKTASISVAEIKHKSSLHADPDMTDAIDEFTKSLPGRIVKMKRLLADGNMVELRRLVHQLKGAGGGFGFDEVTRLAAEAELAIKQQEITSVIEARLSSLFDYMRSIDGYCADQEEETCLILS